MPRPLGDASGASGRPLPAIEAQPQRPAAASSVGRLSRPPGQGFPPARRMHHGAEFRAAYRRGRRRHGPFWALLAARRADPDALSRLGLTTPRRLGAAPLRNRLRRRLRALVRRHWEQLPAGWDLVVQPREAAARAPFPRLEAEWTECLRWLVQGKGPTLGQNKT